MRNSNRLKSINILSPIVVLILVTAGVFGAPGDPDLSFGIGGAAVYETFPLASSDVAENPNYYSCCHVTQQADGKTIVAGGHDGVLRVWNADTAAETRNFPAPADTTNPQASK